MSDKPTSLEEKTARWAREDAENHERVKAEHELRRRDIESAIAAREDMMEHLAFERDRIRVIDEEYAERAERHHKERTAQIDRSLEAEELAAESLVRIATSLRIFIDGKLADALAGK